jgi:hypothetical protein
MCCVLTEFVCAYPVDQHNWMTYPKIEIIKEKCHLIAPKYFGFDSYTAHPDACDIYLYIMYVCMYVYVCIYACMHVLCVHVICFTTTALSDSL